MPESKKRRKVVQENARKAREREDYVPPELRRSPSWWAPTMVALMVIGLVIVVLAYVFSGNVPIPGLGNGNLFIGLGLIIGGFLMTMGWK